MIRNSLTGTALFAYVIKILTSVPCVQTQLLTVAGIIVTTYMFDKLNHGNSEFA